MKWLLPDEENLLRRLQRKAPFFPGEEDTVYRLEARGILSSRVEICPNCGMHPSLLVRITDRGKIACMIADALSRPANV